MSRRRFDHDEAVRRFQCGEYIVDLARDFGVDPSAVRQVLRHAFPGLRQRRLPSIERFWLKVEKHDADCPCCDGCWHWRASTNRLGYGNYHVSRKVIAAHRFAWMTIVGPIPEGIHLHHRCKRPECVNPDHLEAVTPADHVRLHSAERTHCKHGHELTSENTILRRGRRQCKPCQRNMDRRYRERMKQARREAA